jgi:hypothetical protein
MAFDGVREPSGGAQRVSGGQGWTGGDIRQTTLLKLFAGREFTRESSSHCQERTIVVRRITGSGLAVRRQEGGEILLRDAHQEAQAVGPQRAGLASHGPLESA